MVRGYGSDILVIGVCPGKTEVQSGQAFSGAAGKRLMEWLVRGGVGHDREELFDRAYFTSLCKCAAPNKRTLQKAIHNCFPFLETQIRLVQPRIVLPLGREPIQTLFHSQLGLDELIGREWREFELGAGLIPILDSDTIIIPLPHPSPVSRWLNEPEHQSLLESAIQVLRARTS
jgi:uracil-DNA glycosylase